VQGLALLLAMVLLVPPISGVATVFDASSGEVVGSWSVNGSIPVEPSPHLVAFVSTPRALYVLNLSSERVSTEGRSVVINSSNGAPLYIVVGKARVEVSTPQHLVLSGLCVVVEAPKSIQVDGVYYTLKALYVNETKVSGTEARVCSGTVYAVYDPIPWWMYPENAVIIAIVVGAAAAAGIYVARPRRRAVVVYA